MAGTIFEDEELLLWYRIVQWANIGTARKATIYIHKVLEVILADVLNHPFLFLATRAKV